MPNYLDLDSDGDTIPNATKVTEDSDEACDMDGAGDRDIMAIGEDSDDDGVDDALESFTTPDGPNLSYGGESNEAPSTSTAITSQKSDALCRLVARLKYLWTAHTLIHCCSATPLCARP